jgi:glycosyltransferase involved in cell wall biosynthesis/SAM-dependent methyltransferase
MDVCTIIAKNYLAAARVLAESLRENHPESRCHVLVIDGVEGHFDAASEPFEVVEPDALDLPGFERMASLYGVLELATAVKPWLLRKLLQDLGDGVVYLDPDTRIYAPITEVFDAVREHGLVLNPHNTEPMPRDTRKPNEQDILMAGAYNLGFIGLAPSEFSDSFLDWWSERLEEDCIVDPARGFFVDQRWIDLVPGLAPDFHLIRDPGFNVAYWNLPTRELSRSNGHYLVNGSPLRLFHFSGFKTTRPHLLSQYQDRVRLGDDQVLTELCREYASALQAAGHDEASTWPYRYATSHSGMQLGVALRSAFRRAAAEGEVSGSLFDESGEQEFLAWANEPAARGGAHGITRFLESLYEDRPDLRAAYPNLDDPFIAEGYLGWARVHGKIEVPIADSLLPSATLPAAPERPRRERPLGLNVAGYLNAELGVGEVARQLIGALDAHRVPLVPVGLYAPNSRQGHEYATPTKAVAPFDINLICVNADGLPGFAEEAGEQFFEGRHSIGVWWWELSEFPREWEGSFEHVDEVWVGSRFIADALQHIAPVPVFHVPLPVEIVEGLPPARDMLGLPQDEFLFLFAFDYNSVFKRKNPLDLVEAFTRAFEPGDGVRLVVKSINHERDPDNHDRLRIAAAEHPHVRLIETYLPAQDNHRLLASCDAYVSLHRSEGFGIGMAEAILRGKPVVATGYGGNTDFLNEQTGYPVAHTLTKVGEGAWPYDPDAEWAQPDLDDAVRQLRAVVEDPDEAASRVDRGQELLRTVHSPYAAGERMLERLEPVRARYRDWHPEGRVSDALPRIEKIRQRTEQGPVYGKGGDPIRRFARKALLRLIKPYSAHADAISRDLAQLAEETAELAEERTLDAAIASAAALAEARRLSRRLEELNAAAVARDTSVEGTFQAIERRIGSVRPAPGQLGEDYPEAPDGEPWSTAYVERHRDFVTRELADAELLELFRKGEPLPEGLGLGFDERVVEFPWIASRQLSGSVLDAGSALNHLHVLQALRPRMDDLHVVTLSPDEEDAFPRLGISYLYADLRELPFKDASYDRVVSVSTLDHVGLDNVRFGADVPSAENPQAEVIKTIHELRRVLRPGGELYLTLPMGRGERFDWVRSFTPSELDELIEAFEPASAGTEFFRHDGEAGWQRAEREEIAEARYRDHLSGGPVGSDRTVAAEAVACVQLVRRS